MKRCRFSMAHFVPRAGLAALACLIAPPAGAAPITVETVHVGNPGNANDTWAYGPKLGAVAYEYDIGKYEVTIGQYTAFLNAVAASDPLGLYDSRMGTNANIMGIQQNGASGSYTYSPIGSANKPIAFTSWFDAAYFANWMSNGQGGAATIQTGSYNLNGQTSGAAPGRSPGATFYIPTQDEWYKAAYYSPNLNSGTGGYWIFPTQTDTDPNNLIGNTPNQANHLHNLLYSVTQLSTFDSTQNYLTDVGSFSSSSSYYGTFDQGGNLYEWCDLNGDGAGGVNRDIRGGDWKQDFPYYMSAAAFYTTLDASLGGVTIGFRLMSVPEIDPSSFGSALSLAIGAIALCERRRLRGCASAS